MHLKDLYESGVFLDSLAKANIAYDVLETMPQSKLNLRMKRICGI